MSAVISHNWHLDTIVRSVTGKEKLGFLLARSGAALAPLWWAHYADGLIEQINPANGFPRPDPDPAVRSKNVAIPPTIQTQNGLFISHGSKYSGLMRRAVQCQFSRGLETKFGYKWNKTHGIIEYPKTRQVASTPGYEQELLKTRRQWVVEISSAGVYAAPLAIGADCRRCAVDISSYMETGGTELSLSWAFVNKNPSGAVVRLMTAAEIAPAYAAGSPWYLGMGWAFSKSGWAASNVVQKDVFDGESAGLPDYYETRLLDLEFTIAFTGSTLTSLTATGGVATALMAGHGFAEGALVTIFGADQDQYNGAHVIRNVDAGSFQFSVASGIPSPASGPIQAANSAGTATITAALSIGSAGKVTFRPNDLGTLWVPGDEQFTRWDGIPPHFNLVNGSGPVHVFYDGEQKVVTEWNLQSSTIAAEQRLTPHPPQGPPDGVIPVGVNPDSFWNGVTEGFHYWAGPTEYIGPLQGRPNMGSAVPPAPEPCMMAQRPGVVGSGHFYHGYTSLSWGFTGPFNHAVEAYSRRRIETATAFDGDAFHDAGFDWSNSGGYYMCPGNSIPCVGIYIWKTYSRMIKKTTADAAESRGGSSSLILFPMEREAVAGVKRTRDSSVISNKQQLGGLRGVQWRQEGYTPSAPPCQFSQFILERAPSPFVSPAVTTPTTTTSSNSMSFSIRASGGVTISGSLVDGASPNFDPFVVYQVGVKETADSSLFFMNGGLKYADPQLNPPDQTGNRVYILESAAILGGGFAPLPTGRSPVAFIGQV